MSLKIKFGYEQENLTVVRNNEPLDVSRPVTHCALKDGDNVLGESTVRLHQDDVANKIKGRTFAFKKAVNTIADKAVRTALWMQFRGTMNQLT